MPKEKESLVNRANKLIGNNKSFEVETKGDEILIFCKQCNSKFKVDSIHLNTQYKSHITSTKHKKFSEKNIFQPLISSAIAATSVKEKKEDSYSLKLATAFVDAGIPLWKLRHPSIKQFFLQQHKEVSPTAQTFYNKIGVMHESTLKILSEKVPYF